MNFTMNKYKAEQIMDTVQGICGIAEVLNTNMLAKDITDHGPPLSAPVEAHLITGLKQLAYRLNGDTEMLDQMDFSRLGEAPADGERVQNEI